MKRISLFILAIIYLVATTGTSMNLHFCMGKLASWSLWANNENEQCKKCGMEKDEKPNGCCRDEHKWIKMQDDQKASVSSTLSFQQPVSEPLCHPGIIALNNFSQTSNHFSKNHPPPLNHGKVLYKYYCVFLI